MSDELDAMIAVRRRAETVARMRSLARTGLRPQVSDTASPGAERCDICNAPVPDDHRHLLHLVDRRIACACEACWALHSGDAEYRPTGMRTLWLTGFSCPEETWAGFRIPIGLAFFMRSAVTGSIVAFYPSPAGATESELALPAWDALVAANPVLGGLESDAEALVVDRISDPAQYAVVPIDQCYTLVGLIKSRWEGISGGTAVQTAVPEFLASLRARSVPIAAAEALR